MKNIVRMLLQESKVNIVSAVGHLDRSEGVCGECARRSFSNWNEAQMARELEAVVNKLDKWLNKKDWQEKPGLEVDSENGEGAL